MGFILKITGLIVITWGVLRAFFIIVEIGRGYVDLHFIDLSIVFMPIVMGLLIIGFGEVIDLLQKVFDQNEPEKVLTEVNEEPVVIRNISLYAEQDLEAFYSNKNMEIHTINPTRDRDVFAVEVDGRTEYIELGGFSPKVLSEKEAEKYL